MADTKSETSEGYAPAPTPKPSPMGGFGFTPPPASATGGGSSPQPIAGTQDRPYALAKPEVKSEYLDVYDLIHSMSGKQGIQYGFQGNYVYAQESLKTRAAYLPTVWVRDNPFTALHLITSQMPGDQLRQVGRQIGAVNAWLHTRDPDFMLARAVAMGLPAGAIRAEVMEFLDNRGVISAQGISPQGAATETLLHGEAGPLRPAVDAQGNVYSQSAFSQAAEAGAEAAHGIPVVGEPISNAIQAAFVDPTPLYRKIFLLARLPLDVMGAAVSEIGGDVLSAVSRYAPNVAFGGIGAAGIKPAVDPALQQWIHDHTDPEDFSNAINTAFGRATDLPVAAAAMGGRQLSDLFGIDDSNVNWSKYIFPEQPGTAIGLFVADDGVKLGLWEEGSYAYQTAAEASDLIAQLAVGAAIGGFAKGLREAGRIPDLNALPEGAPPEVVRAYQMALRERAQRLGVFGEVGYELRSKTWEEYIRSNKFTQRVVKPIEMLKATYGKDNLAGEIQLRFPASEVTPGLARNLARAETADDYRITFDAYTRGNPDPVRMAQDQARLTEIAHDLGENPPAPGEAMRADQYDLLSEAYQIQDRLSNPSNYRDIESVFAFPRNHVGRSLYYNLPNSRWAAWVRPLLNPTNRVAPHMIRMFDDLGDFTLHQPGAEGAVGMAARLNADTVRNLFNRVGVKTSETARVLDRLAKVDIWDTSAWYDAVRDVFETAAGSPMIDGLMRKRLEQFAGYASAEARRRMVFETRIGADGKGIPVMEDVLFKTKTRLGREEQYAMPAMSAEFIGSRIHLPPLDDWIDATSWWRSWKKNNPGKAMPFDAIKAVSTGATLVLKPIVLTAFGLRIPALAMRIIGEEILRKGFYGYGYHIGRPRDLSAWDFEMPRSKIGGAIHKTLERRRWASDRAALEGIVRETLLENGEMVTGAKVGRIERQAAANLKKLYQKEAAPDLGSIVFDDKWGVGKAEYKMEPVLDEAGDLRDIALDGIADRALNIMQSPEMRALIRRGPDGFVDWLKSKDGAHYLDQLTPNIKRHLGGEASLADVEAFLPEFARRHWQAINEMVPAIVRDGIPNGQVWYRPEALVETVEQRLANRKLGERYKDEYSQMVEQDAMLRDAAREVYSRGGDPGQVAALRDLRYDTLERIKELERLAKVHLKSNRYDLRDPERLKDVLRDMYNISKDKAASYEAMGLRGDELRAAVEKDGGWLPPHRVSAKDVKPEGWGTSTKAGFTAMNRYLYDHGVFGSFRTVTALDTRLARGPVYKLEAEETYQRLRSLGYDESRARTIAKAKGAMAARDTMYDLAKSSSMMRYMKNLFWFGPAYQELLSTWFVKIPSQYYFPVGIALLYNKAHLLTQFAKTMGWMTKDENGQDQVMVPFLGHLLDRIEGPGGALVKDLVRFNPQSLNFVGSGGNFKGVPVPGLSTQYNQLLSWWARGQIPGVRNAGINIAQALSEVLQPYGQDIRLGPPALNFAYTAITGEAPPWEYLSADYQGALFDLGADDALRQARVIVGAEPDPASDKYEHDEQGNLTNAGRDAFRKDHKAWQDEILGQAHDIVRGTAFIRLIGATVSPVSLRVTDQYKLDAAKTLDKIYGSRGADAPVGSDAYIAWNEWKNRLYDEYLSNHPDGYFYLVGRTALGDKQRDLPYSPAEEDDFWTQFQAQLFTGERRVLSQEEYLRKAAGWESYRRYSGQLHAAYEDAGITDAPSALLNGFERKLDNLTFQRDWQNYLKLNPTFAAELKEQRLMWAKQGSAFPEQSMTAELIMQTKRDLDMLAQFFTIDGVRSKDYKVVQAELAKLLSDKGEFGPPTSEVAKGLSWYYDTVLGPYFDKLAPLFDKADEAASAGADAGPFWDQIRQINNQYGNRHFIGPDGKTYPSPEAALWSNRSLEEQDQAKLGWATKPMSWLTEFQRETLHFDLPSFADQYYAKRNAIYDAFYAKVNKEGWSTSSNDYERAKDQRDAAVQQLANSYGPQGQQLEEYESMAPYQRLRAAGLTGFTGFAQIASMVDTVTQKIIAAGFSPKGWGKVATDQKTYLYGIIASKRDETSPNYDPALDDFLTDLGRAIPLAGKDAREGVPLYEALFFGQFNITYIPYDVRNQFGPDYQSQGGQDTSYGFTPAGG